MQPTFFIRCLRFDALALGATAGKAYLTFRIDGQPKEMFYLRQAASDVGLSSGSQQEFNLWRCASCGRFLPPPHYHITCLRGIRTRAFSPGNVRAQDLWVSLLFPLNCGLWTYSLVWELCFSHLLSTSLFWDSPCETKDLSKRSQR